MKDLALQQKVIEFFANYTRQVFGPRHIIVPAFSQPSGVYCVKSGHVKQYSLTPEGNELIVNIYKPGAFFPMIWAVTDRPNNYFFEAMDEVVIYRAPKEEVLRFLQSEPDVLYDLCKRLYIGLDGVLQQMTFNSVSDVRKKVVATLLMLGKRFGTIAENTIIVDMYVTHKEIGLFSGTSRETVTRMLHQLHEEGLIEIKHKQLTLLDVKKLEEVLVQ